MVKVRSVFKMVIEVGVGVDFSVASWGPILRGMLLIRVMARVTVIIYTILI